MKSEYRPVDCMFYDMLESTVINKQETAVRYFDESGEVQQVQGKITDIVTERDKGEFTLLDHGEKIRLDRIITLDDKPGPAMNEYHS